MSLEKVPPESRFKATVMGMCDVMLEIVNNQKVQIVNPITINIVKFFLILMSDDALIDRFISYSHTHWHKMHEKDKKYFVAHSDSIFGDLPTDAAKAQVNVFAVFFMDEKSVTKTDEELLWEYFHSLVKIAIKYIHQTRKPYLKSNGSPGYRERYMEDVNLIEISQRWNVDLTFT